MIKIISLLKNISDWSLPAKFLLSAILSTIGGAGLLSYLVEYATYWYAISFGFRPPVEGIPYLRSTVAAGSIFLLISGAIIAFSTLFSLRGMVKQFTNKSHPLNSLIEKFLPLEGIPLFLFVASVSGTIGYTTYLASTLICRFSNNCRGAEDIPLFLTICLSITSALLIVLSRFPRFVWWFSAGYVLIYYILIVGLIFQPSVYAQFLRATGFGGGSAVEILIDEDVESEKFSNDNYYLMLRTANVFILYNSTSLKFEERPVAKVRRVTYEVGGLASLPFKLPE